MARHHVEKVRTGFSNPHYNDAKEKRRAAKAIKETKKSYELYSLSPEAKKLWNQMFNSK